MDDICANRHGGNQFSVAAGAQGRDVQRQKVLAFIVEQGLKGATTDEIAAAWNVGSNSCSGRMTELRKMGLIVQVGTRYTRMMRMAAVFVAASLLSTEVAPTLQTAP